MSRKISRSEATDGLRSLRHIGVDAVEISCPRVAANGFRDIIELYLRGTGTADILWRDSQGQSVRGQGLGVLLRNCARDFAAWPYLAWRHRQLARQILSANTATQRKSLPSTGNDHRALYLRSDHWFDIKSGGSVGHVRGVVDGLRGLGIRTFIASTDYLTGLDREQDFELCTPVYDLGRNIPELPELQYNHQMLSQIGRSWAGWQPSFVYQRIGLGNYVGAALRSRYRIPFVAEYNGSIAWMARHWDKRPLFLEKTALTIEHAVLASADLVIVVSDASRDELLARGIAAERILVNPNGVDPDTYAPDIDGEPVRLRHGIEKDDIVIGFIGTFGKWHGADMLARAYALLRSRHPQLGKNLKLLMIGDGPGRSAAEAVVRNAGVADGATFTGLIPQGDGPGYLAACDILASPHVPNPDGTPFFGSPTKLFEYMAMGRPIVASNLDQIGQILRADDTALLVRPGDVEALAAAFVTLAGDPGLRHRLGKAARQDVVTHYSWLAHTRRIMDALKAPA